MNANSSASASVDGKTIVSVIESIISAIDECHAVESEIHELPHFTKFGEVLHSLRTRTSSTGSQGLELVVGSDQRDWISKTDPFLLQEVLTDHKILLKRI